MALLKNIAVAGVPQEEVESEPALVALRAAPNAADRRAAARQLADRAEALEELAAALAAEPEESVRQAIFGALVGIGTDAAAMTLATFLAHEDCGLRCAAIEALQRVGAPALTVAERLLSSPDRDQRIFAVNVLEGLSHRGALELLLRVLEQDVDLNVGLATVEALALLGGPEDAPALRAFAARFPTHGFVGFAVDLACARVGAGIDG